jgi:AsmA protein
MARHARRLILWICGGALALVLLAALAVVALVWLVDPNVYRTRLAAAATNSLGRPLTLGGDLAWSIGWDLGVESRDGSIANAPGFGETPFARWRTLRVGLDARALLQKRIVVDRLEVDGLELNLERNAAGEGNWVFMPKQAGIPDEERHTDFQIASVRLRNSRLTFSDATGAATPDARVWRLDDVALAVDLPADLKASQRELRELSLSGRLMAAPLAVKGVSVAFDAASIRHDAAAGTLDMPQFRARWLDADLSGNVHASLGDQAGELAVAAQGKAALHIPSVRAVLASLNTTLPPMADSTTLGGLAGEAAFELKNNALTVTDLKAKLDDTALNGKVSIGSFSPLALRFDLAGDAIDLDRYMEPAGYEGKPLELPLGQLKDLDAQGVLVMKSAKVAGATAEEVRIDVE